MEFVDEVPPRADDAPPVNRIRVETALSRFPIHRLAKKDAVTIDLQQAGANGEPAFCVQEEISPPAPW